jgi:nucleoside-diphosphate-sugar epimerase
VLEVANEPLEQVIYVSTTGVYGDAGGDWIDETTPTNPHRPGGIASLAAEMVLKESRFAPHGVILRLAGIYGPGRLPYIQQLRRGEPLDASSDGYLNLIHVDDAAELIVAMTGRKLAAPGPLTYCVSDGQPVWREEFYNELARQLGAPPPQFVQNPKSQRHDRGGTSKRVSNQKVMDAYRFALRYPSYREGIAQIARDASVT